MGVGNHSFNGSANTEAEASANCRACGRTLCDCPDLAFAGIAPALIQRADAASPSEFRGAFGSHATNGAGVAGQSRSGADLLSPDHEVEIDDRA